MMSRPTTSELTALAHEAGYHVVAAEQLRQNRWLLTLHDPRGAVVLALVQARPLVGAADVQDLAEIARLRRPHRSLLLAYGGSFSPSAQRTLAELGPERMQLCTTLPIAARHESGDAHSLGATVPSR